MRQCDAFAIREDVGARPQEPATGRSDAVAGRAVGGALPPGEEATLDNLVYGFAYINDCKLIEAALRKA